MCDMPDLCCLQGPGHYDVQTTGPSTYHVTAAGGAFNASASSLGKSSAQVKPGALESHSMGSSSLAASLPRPTVTPVPNQDNLLKTVTAKDLQRHHNLVTVPRRNLPDGGGVPEVRRAQWAGSRRVLRQGVFGVHVDGAEGVGTSIGSG